MKLAEIVMPLLMVRNEEYWLRRVLRPLCAVFGRALLVDTGSTDNTVAEARLYPEVEIITYGVCTPQQLGSLRQEVSATVAARYPLIMQVDGDELYHPRALAALAAYEVTTPVFAGFVQMVTVDQDESGQLYETDDVFSRLAFWPAGDRHDGAYPFEAPQIFQRPEFYVYLPLPPALTAHALHLHRLPRSPHDEQVFMRQEKRFLCALQSKALTRTRLCAIQEYE